MTNDTTNIYICFRKKGTTNNHNDTKQKQYKHTSTDVYIYIYSYNDYHNDNNKRNCETTETITSTNFNGNKRNNKYCTYLVGSSWFFYHYSFHKINPNLKSLLEKEGGLQRKKQVYIKYQSLLLKLMTSNPLNLQ